MKILFASHSYISENLVVGSHHLAREFAAMGHEVLHLSTPVTPAHFLRDRGSDRLRAWKRGLIRHPNGVLEIVPFTLLAWQIARHINPRAYMAGIPLLGRQLRKAGFSRPDLLLIDEPRMAAILDVARPNTTIYRATDLYADMRADPHVTLAELDAINRSAGLIGTAQPVVEHLRRLAPQMPVLVMENGVDTGHFSYRREPPTPYSAIPGPRLLYVGALDRRFDFPLINALAERAPRWNIILAGPETTHLAELRRDLPNIHYVGPVPYRHLPAWMQHADVGLLPLNDDPSNRGRSPMKLYEYAAAGLQVAARETPELARRNEPFVHLYQNLDGILAALQEILQAPKPKTATSVSLSRHAWNSKAREVLDFADNLRAPQAPPVRELGACELTSV